MAAAGMTSEAGRDDEPRCGLVIERAIHPNLQVMSFTALRSICYESGVWFDSIVRMFAGMFLMFATNWNFCNSGVSELCFQTVKSTRKHVFH